LSGVETRLRRNLTQLFIEFELTANLAPSRPMLKRYFSEQALNKYHKSIAFV